MEIREKRPCIRGMKISDYPEIAAIEAIMGEDGFITEEDFCKKFRPDSTIGVVIEGGRILAYAFFKLNRKGIRIRRIAVAPDKVREGLGSTIVSYIYQYATAGENSVISVVVHESNTIAQFFFRSLGFQATGSRVSSTRGLLYLMEYFPNKV